MILNKIDLLPYVPFKPELARGYALRIHPEIEIIHSPSNDTAVKWIADATVLSYFSRSIIYA